MIGYGWVRACIGLSFLNFVSKKEGMYIVWFDIQEKGMNENIEWVGDII